VVPRRPSRRAERGIDRQLAQIGEIGQIVQAAAPQHAEHEGAGRQVREEVCFVRHQQGALLP
jgi:hypothetical protein